MAGSDEDRGRSRRPGAEDWEWSITDRVLSGWTIERLGDIVCGLHQAQGDDERGFLGLASKPRSTVSHGLALKPVTFSFFGLGLKTGSCGLVIWPIKSPRRFLGLCLKNKLATVCRLCHKTNGLLHLEMSRARVSQSSVKTSGGTTRMVHMASLQRSRGDEAEDGRGDETDCIRFFYPSFVVFIVLCHKGSLVISFPINRTPRVGGED
jgi:hypothetical protein